MDQAERELTQHLQRASELLRGDKLDEAEREIGSARKLRADDLRVRNLHGLLLFRAGKYDEARAAYVGLMQAYPSDTALRLNLGLVELRMGRYADAASNLKRVLDAEPDNTRAHGYLGLALMRSGDLDGAREAFQKGGQPELAAQAQERMATSQAAVKARSDLRQAAKEGEEALSKAEPFAAVELEDPAKEAERGAWQVKNPGGALPLPGPEGADDASALPLMLEPPRPVAAFATARLLRPGGLAGPFALAEGGMLVISVEGRLPTRTFGAIASTGQLTFEPLMRRVRGQATEEPFGEGAEAMFVSLGTGLMAVAPRGARFTLLALAEDIVYIREPSVFAFEQSLYWENGRVPGGASDFLRVVQFRGTGRLVFRTERATFTLKIEPDAPLFVDSSTLLGWIGRVVPRVLHGENDQPTPYIECTGEGVLILEEPGAL